MNTAVTLTADEFREIHNALCFANSKGIEATVDAIREALAGAYAAQKVFEKYGFRAYAGSRLD